MENRVKKRKGIGASSGIAIGRAQVVNTASPVSDSTAKTADKEAELAALDHAIATFCETTERLANRLDESGGTGEILRGHILMISDPFMTSGIKDKIEQGYSAADAVCEMCDMFITAFEASEDDLTRQRAADVRDIKGRLLDILGGNGVTELCDLPPNTVLIVDELTPSMTAEMDREHVIGVVTHRGGLTSHCAILARSMKIPAVLSVPDDAFDVQTGDSVALNGDTGEVWLAPDENTVARLRALDAEERKKNEQYKTFIGKKTLTKDGEIRHLFSNIGSDREIGLVLENDAEGVGLFRTEFLFMGRNSLPDEEQQLAAYRAAATGLHGKPLIIRTLDIGGDKDIPYLGLEKEENPFLGYRAIRFCLSNRNIFQTQLRAILRASAFGDVRILLPLIVELEELQQAKEIIEEVKETLRRQAVPFDEHIPVGVMIETPAACMIAEFLAKEADFFSIGTNDLTQYIMAADRGNAHVASLYSPFRPAVLRAIRHVIASAKEAGIPAGMCGEAASDRYLIPLFLAFGLTEFSVTPSLVLSVRAEISRWSQKRAEEIAEHVMSLSSEAEIRSYLASVVDCNL